MTKKLKHFSELPEWFDLKNYKKANNISDYEWYIQLIIRKYCISSKYLLELTEPLDIIRKKTFVGLHHHYFFRHWHDILSKINIEQFIIRNSVTNTKNPAISPLTLRKFFNIQKFLPQDRKTYRQEFTDYLINAIQSASPDTHCIDLSEEYTKSLNAPKQDWLYEPIYKSLPEYLEAAGLIHVNLDFTDDQLIEHFRNWLCDIRTELQKEMKSKTFKQSDFNSWALYGVLPYLDLKIWEMEKNVSIPNRVMADAIYLAGVGGEDTVRKTTAPLVEHILSEKSLNQLAGQVILHFQKIEADLNAEQN